jgi:hypothetical protein
MQEENILHSEDDNAEAVDDLQIERDNQSNEELQSEENNKDDLRNEDESAGETSTAVQMDHDLSENYNSSDSSDSFDSFNLNSDEDNTLQEEGLFSDDDESSNSTRGIIWFSFFIQNFYTKANSLFYYLFIIFIELNEELSESFIKTLQLLNIKNKHNLTDHAFNDILKLYGNGESSLYIIQKKLAEYVSIKPTFIPMCVNSCCAFIDQFANNETCPWCGQASYSIDSSNVKSPRKVATFLPLLDRLKIQYNDPKRSLDLRYRHHYINNNEYEKGGSISDIFDGNLYKELSEDGFFKDERDIALIGSMDGYQIFKQRTEDCWVVMFINANLPSNERVKKENLLISAVIPGPSQPKNFNSFLRPIVDELKMLKGKILIILFIYYR